MYFSEYYEGNGNCMNFYCLLEQSNLLSNIMVAPRQLSNCFFVANVLELSLCQSQVVGGAGADLNIGAVDSPP